VRRVRRDGGVMMVLRPWKEGDCPLCGDDCGAQVNDWAHRAAHGVMRSLHMSLTVQDLAHLAEVMREEHAGTTVDELRARGWLVGVHNDYLLGRDQYTFWLFTKGSRCAKGEGRTDAEALAKAKAEIDKIDKEGEAHGNG